MASSTTHEHNQIRLETQRQRASEISRHQISKLAHELLKKRLDERLATCVRTNLDERARTLEKHAFDAAKLVTEHERENQEFEDARPAMIAEFDAQRDKLRPPPAKMLEEVFRHEILLETLKVKLVLDDQTAKELLQQAVRSCDHCRLDASTDDFIYFEQVQRVTLKRHAAYEQIVRKHEAEWKVRQEALRLELDNRISHQARLELECDFQLRFAECDQRQKAAQQRQADELKDLENERSSELKAVQEAGERAETDLQEERRRVEEWWQHLCDKNAASLWRIEEDETRLLDAIYFEEAIMKAEEDRADKSSQAGASGIVKSLLEEREVGEALEITTANEADKADTSHRILHEQTMITGPHETTCPLATATCDAGELQDPALSGSSGDVAIPSSLLLADTRRLQVASFSNGLSQRPTLSMTFNSQYNFTADSAPTISAHQTIMANQFSRDDSAGSVPDRCDTPESGGSDSDFVEI